MTNKQLKVAIEGLCSLPVAAQVLQFGLARISECDDDRWDSYTDPIENIENTDYTDFI